MFSKNHLIVSLNVNQIHTCCGNTTRKRGFNGDCVQYRNKCNFYAKKSATGKNPPRLCVQMINWKLDCGFKHAAMTNVRPMI